MPQVRAMYNGDRARKENLIEYGFRLPSALDNRPLKFEEFQERINQIVYVSATPGPYEMEVQTNVAEQIIRPTGLLDPEIEVRPIRGQMDDLLGEIKQRTAKNERVLVTTLTKKMAEDLTEFLKEVGVRVRYLHSDIATIERADIIRDLRAGVFDVLVGINLLREGLDMPEVSLVAILDADKEGFLRSDTSLIQTIGRAARNEHGRVIMYADRITGSMERAISETERRREVQQAYNKAHNITPKSIRKEVKELIELTKLEEEVDSSGSTTGSKRGAKSKSRQQGATDVNAPKQRQRASKTEHPASSANESGNVGRAGKHKNSLQAVAEGIATYGDTTSKTVAPAITVEDIFNDIETTTRLMKAAAKQLEFEKAAELRDKLGILRQQLSDLQDAHETKPKRRR